MSGMELAKAWVTVGADNSQLPGDLENTRSQVNAAMNAMATGAAAMFGTIAAAGTRWLGQGLNAAGAFEKTTVEMETMIGSATETQKTLADLTKFAVDTPFEMPQLLQVTQGLIQFGERGDGLMKTIKMLGDASGGTNEKFQLLGMVFNQVRGVGKLLTQDFRQLSTRGIISLQDIAKHYKVTTAAAQDMLSNGKISFNDFRKIMQGLTEGSGRFANMMSKTSTTLEGLRSTMSDAVGISLRMLATPLVPYVKGLYIGVIQLANAMAKLTTYGGETVSFAFVAAVGFSTLGAAINGAGIALRFFGLSWSKLIYGAIRVMPWIALAAAIGAVVGWIVSSKPVIDVFTKLWEKAQKKVEEISRVFSVFFNEISPKFTRIGASVDRIMVNMGRAVEDFVDWSVKLIESGVDSWIDPIKRWIAYAVDSFETILGWVEFFTQDFSATWELIRIQGALAFTWLTQAAVVMATTIVAYLMAAGTAVFTLFSGVFYNLAEMLVWLGSTFLATGLYVVGIFQDVAHNVMVSFKIAFGVIGALFSALWKGIVAKVSGKGGFAEVFASEYERAVAAAKRGNEIKEVGVDAEKERKRRQQEANQKFDLKNPIQEASDAFQNTLVSNLGPDEPFKDTLGDLANQRQAIIDDIKWQQEADRLVAEANKPKKTKAQKALDKAKKGEDNSTFALPAGRLEFAEVGNKVQDLLLGKGKDHGAEQVGLLQAGLNKQDEQIKAIKDIPKPGLGK